MTSIPPNTAGSEDTSGADDSADAGLPHLPLVDDVLEHDRAEASIAKPSWRGWIHAGTFPVALALGIVLITLAHGAPAKWSTGVFALSSLLLFGVSALYHRINWRDRTRAVFRRLDHANIFLLIAGSYTPITVLALPHDKSVLLLWMVWIGAGLGILFHVFWIGAPRWLYVPLYLLLSYACLIFIGDFFAANAAMMTLILVGGVFYTIGAVIYGMKRPNPFPGHFGFHEIFHALTLLAFLCHWVGIFLIATAPPVLG